MGLKRIASVFVAVSVLTLLGAVSLLPGGACFAQEKSAPQAASAPEAMQFVRLNEQGMFELEDGTPFYVLGVLGRILVDIDEKHPLVGEIAVWDYASEEQLRQYFKYLRGIGATTVTLFPCGTRLSEEPDGARFVHGTWGRHQLDVCGKVNPEQWFYLDRYLNVARESGIRVIVYLFFRDAANIYVNAQGQLDSAAQKYWSKEELARLPAHQKRFLVEKRWLGRGAWAQVDLGEERTVDTIKLWHLHRGEGLNSRVRENKVALSTTGEFRGEETVIFDSTRDGEYPETPAGKTITFKPTKARYVRNWVSGISGHWQRHCWNEIQVYSQNVGGGTKNLAKGKRVTASDIAPSWSLQNVTDGNPKSRAGLSVGKLFYTDPDVVACQESYLRDLTSRLKDRPEVLGYFILCERIMNDRVQYDWTNRMIAIIRSIDDKHLIGDTYGYGGVIRPGGFDGVAMSRGTEVDFFTYSLYGEGGQTTEFGDYGIQADVASRYGLLGKPVFSSEGGLFSQAFWGVTAQMEEEKRYLATRDLIWFQLTSGCPGAVWYFGVAKDGFYKSELLEFAPASHILREAGLAKWRRARPEVGIQVDQAKLWNHYPNMLRYSSHFLSKGVDFDFTFDNKPYAVKLSTAEFKPQGPADRPFEPAAGYQLKYFLDESSSKTLIYLRNCAGIEEFAREYIKGSHASVWLRTRKPAEARIELNLPQGQYELKAWNLDTGQTTTHTIPGTGPIVLGSDTRDDFVILVRKRGTG